MTNKPRNRQSDYWNSARLWLRPNAQRDLAIDVSDADFVQNGSLFRCFKADGSMDNGS